MQFQADVLGVPVRRAARVETTALGAAGLAGIAAGIWPDGEVFAASSGDPEIYSPAMGSEERDALIAGWERAVAAARNWARGGDPPGQV